MSTFTVRHRSENATLICGDAFHVMTRFHDESFDLIVADPPYFLSNGGTTCSGGKRVAVDKGEWDRLGGESMRMYGDLFSWNRAWLAEAQRILKPTGSIVVCGSMHNIYSVGQAMSVLEFHMLNEIVWEKPAPPPNLGCRSLTHSHETLLWARMPDIRGPQGGRTPAKHYFADKAMREYNEGKQLKDVWRIGAPRAFEKRYGKHPAQKPEELLERVLTMACPAGGAVLDPFQGSGTTGVVATRLGLSYVGIDMDEMWLDVAKARMGDVGPGEMVMRLQPGAADEDEEEVK